MGWGKKDKDNDEVTEKANKKLERETNPEQAARLGSRSGTLDAYCNTCKAYYDSTKDALKHDH